MSNNDQQQVSDNSDEISLRDLILKTRNLWRYLLSKWIIILIAGAIGGISGLVYAYLSKPFYTAELSFAVQNEKSGSGLGSAAGLASQFGIDIGGANSGGEFSGDNLLELMKSRSMVERALLTAVIVNGNRETLAEFYINFNKLRDTWKTQPKLINLHFLPGADPTKFTLAQDSLLGVFHSSLIYSDLEINKLDKKLSIATLKVKSTNELFAKNFTEVLEKVVSDYYIQTKTEKASKNVAILQRQTDSVRRALNAAISGVAESMDINPNPNPSRQTLRVPSQRKQVDVQANTIILSELVKNLEAAKMLLLQDTPLIQIIDGPILPLPKQRAGKLHGIIVGGVIAGFLIVIILVLGRWVKNILSDNN
jgi:uncharacterized membrane protein YgcG